MIVNDGIIFLCMADEDFGKRQPYAFLEEVRLNGEGLQEITEKIGAEFMVNPLCMYFFFKFLDQIHH